jgi:hypothetical protein
VKEKAELCTDFAPFVSLTSFCEGLRITFKILLQIPVRVPTVMPFTSRTLVTEAVKRGGDYGVLLNSHFNEVYIAFYKLLLHRDHLVRKSMPSIMCQGYISTGKHN